MAASFEKDASASRISRIDCPRGRGSSPAARAAAGSAVMTDIHGSASDHRGRDTPFSPSASRKSCPAQVRVVPGGATSAAIASSMSPKENGGGGRGGGEGGGGGSPAHGAG